MNGIHIENLPGMIGRHPLMLELYGRAQRLAPSTLPVLVVGETGTGKELVARAIHGLSRRAAGPFVPVNCAAVPEGVAEAELFGVEVGAFTGAVRRRMGYLARAHGGTLFLDEVDSAPMGFQAKLLRAVEFGEFERLGSPQTERADFRLVAATSRAPAPLVAAGVLREDLLHRLAPSRLFVPPLRERPTDIAALANHFLPRANGNGHPSIHLHASAIRVLLAYDWPGNVRQLRGLMETLAVLVGGPLLTARDVDLVLAEAGRSSAEAPRLCQILEAHGWNVTAAARAAGVGRTKFYELLRRHRVTRPTPADG